MGAGLSLSPSRLSKSRGPPLVEEEACGGCAAAIDEGPGSSSRSASRLVELSTSALGAVQVAEACKRWGGVAGGSGGTYAADQSMKQLSCACREQEAGGRAWAGWCEHVPGLLVCRREALNLCVCACVCAYLRVYVCVCLAGHSPA